MGYNKTLFFDNISPLKTHPGIEKKGRGEKEEKVILFLFTQTAVDTLK